MGLIFSAAVVYRAVLPDPIVIILHCLVAPKKETGDGCSRIS